MATNPSSTAMAIHLLCFFCAKWWLLPLLLLDHTLSSSSPLPTSWGVWANLGKIPRRVEPCNYQISHAAAAGSYYLLLSFFYLYSSCHWCSSTPLLISFSSHFLSWKRCKGESDDQLSLSLHCHCTVGFTFSIEICQNSI